MISSFIGGVLILVGGCLVWIVWSEIRAATARRAPRIDPTVFAAMGLEAEQPLPVPVSLNRQAEVFRASSRPIDDAENEQGLLTPIGFEEPAEEDVPTDSPILSPNDKGLRRTGFRSGDKEDDRTQQENLGL